MAIEPDETLQPVPAEPSPFARDTLAVPPFVWNNITWLALRDNAVRTAAPEREDEDPPDWKEALPEYPQPENPLLHAYTWFTPTFPCPEMDLESFISA